MSFPKFAIFLVVFTFSFSDSWAVAKAAPQDNEIPRSTPLIEHGCFGQHLKDAIVLNKQRMPIYSALTHGASKKISKTLIRYEKWASWAAWYYDLKAKYYQKRGIPILCDEFVSMNEVPEFRSTVRAMIQDPSNLKNPEKLNTSEVKSQIKKAYKQNGFAGVSVYLEGYLADLEKSGSNHCMIKHILESVLRAANLAPKHIQASEAAHLSSTRGLSWGFIKLQLYSLSAGDDLDIAAFPIHAKGVPIICQDVPKIPAE